MAIIARTSNSGWIRDDRVADATRAAKEHPMLCPIKIAP